MGSAVKYVIFTFILLFLFYLIPQPKKRADQITFEISRDHQEKGQLIDHPSYNSVENSETLPQKEKLSLEPSTDDLFDVASIDTSQDSNNKVIPESKQPKQNKPTQTATTPAEKSPTTKTLVSNNASSQPFDDLDNEPGLSDTEYFRKFVQIYNDQKLRGVTPESRKDVVIRYYVKEKDEDKVFSLRQLGFYIHERPTSEAYQGLPTNALYYGNEVNIEDLKMVAYTLLRKGVELRLIEPSKFSNDWKARSIEIGTEDGKVEFPLISLADIRQLTL